MQNQDMSADLAYEAAGLRPTGKIYTLEVLGHCPEAVALDLAQQCADRWQCTVNLYRVPFVHTGSTPWADDQQEFVCQLPPTR